MRKLLAGLAMAGLLMGPAFGSEACRLPEMGVLRDVGLGFPRIPFRLKTTGDIRFRVLFVDFSDVPATRSTQDVMAIISPQAQKFYQAVSYGRMNLVFDAHPQWIRMNRPSADYGFKRGSAFDVQRSYMQEAVDLAGPLDYSRIDAILVIAYPAVEAIDWGPGFAALPGSGIRAGGKEIINGATSGSDLTILGWPWFNHEIGHVMSLVDLAGPLPANQLWHTYVGDFSIMGNPVGVAKEFFGWERWQLGWLDDQQVVCAQGLTTVATLAPIERAGGKKMIIVPTGKTSAVIVESRHAEGYDSALPKSGPLVYTIDTRLTTHDGAIKIYPVSDTDTHHLDAPMNLGETLVVGEVSVTFLSRDQAGETVRVTKTRP